MADTKKHILTQVEAFDALRISSADECPNLEMLLDSTDEELKSATGRDWSKDDPVDPDAKTAAMLYLISLDDGAEVPQTYISKTVQLGAKAKGMTT
ncbi:conserved protein of unknown function [Ruminococcaceae bacterium BL-6]|nr:conserved protein of unknown function [Ruminococcaceae bacterium BL-6]